MSKLTRYPECKFPHCDMNVLHAPGDCVYCDLYPELQNERIEKGINFTGMSSPRKDEDPATQKRPLDVINRWGGNVPVTQEDLDRHDREWAEFIKSIPELKAKMAEEDKCKSTEE